MKKNILLLLLTIQAFWSLGQITNNPRFRLYEQTDFSGISVEMIDYNGASLFKCVTDSYGQASFPDMKKYIHSYYKIQLSKNGYSDISIDSVSFYVEAAYNNQYLIAVKSADTSRAYGVNIGEELWPTNYIKLSDTLSHNLTRDYKYFVMKATTINKNISIEPGTNIHFQSKLILASGIKFKAIGNEKDSIVFFNSKFDLGDSSSIDFSFCKMAYYPQFRTTGKNVDIKITNSNIPFRNNTYYSAFILGKQLSIYIDHCYFSDISLFLVDSLISLEVRNSTLINSSFGQISNSRTGSYSPYEETDTLKYPVKISRNYYTTYQKLAINSDLKFVKNINSTILFKDNTIETYKFRPISIETDHDSKTFFLNNKIKGSFDVYASEKTTDDTYNLVHFVGNNMELNGYSSIKNNYAYFSNNLLNLNSYQLTIHGAHNGCPCAETSAYLSSNTIVGGRFWFNTSSNGARYAYMNLSDNIIIAEVITDELSGKGNIIKKDLNLDYFKQPSNITDDETMEAWVYHNDKNELYDGSNLYVSSDEILNKIPPYYHGFSPFTDTLIWKNHQAPLQKNRVGYNPIGTSLDTLFPSFKVLSPKDTCIVRGNIEQGKDDPLFFSRGKVMLINKNTGEWRVTSSGYHGSFMFSYLPKGEYILQVIPNNSNFYSTFYLNSINPSTANALFVEGEVYATIDCPKIGISQSSTVKSVKGKVIYKDKTKSDKELAMRFNPNENVSTLTNSAQFLPLVLRNSNGEVLYSTMTDFNGDFEFPNVALGSYTFESQRFGYQLEGLGDIFVGQTNGNFDRNLIKEETVSGIEMNDIYAITPSVLPSPFTNQLTIKTVDLNSPIQIIDAMGKIVYDQKTTDFVSNVNTTDWPNGVYIVRTGEIVAKVLK